MFTASSHHTPYVKQVCKMRTTTMLQDFSRLLHHHLASQWAPVKITVLSKSVCDLRSTSQETEFDVQY